ncbi:MAG: hypothetical protein LBQ47_04570 [Endomicrobium sp.]|jgi:hypothetical protein|nr:hypothetical protein [Endomicrobium sp.]
MNTLYVLSGPPAAKDRDFPLIKRFVSLDGKKAVCGSVTLGVFCRISGKTAGLKFVGSNAEEPPEYEVEGLDFASEGIITLNKCFEVLNAKGPACGIYFPARKLARLMLECDIIHFIEGSAINRLHDVKLFKKAGVLPRSQIIDKIIKKLESAGKIAIKEIV